MTEEDNMKFSFDKSQWSLLPNTNTKTNTNPSADEQMLSMELPKFKLNEPGPAALASSIFQQNNMALTDDNEQSFVVLSRSSFDSFREAFLASFSEIQEKATTTDHSSLISMMSPSEIEENLKKVLEENIKLKETLKQNNSAIKQQLQTISMWQKEVMTICGNHKQKFVETKELINRLKKENDEMRENIAKSQQEDSQECSTLNNTSLIMQKSDFTVVEDTQMLTDSSLNEKESEIQNDLIMQQMDEKFKKAIELDIENWVKQPLDALKEKTKMSNSIEMQSLINKCCEKDGELNYLKEIIASLEQQLQKINENNFPLIDLQIDNSGEASEERRLLKENVEIYNAKLAELDKCYASQCSRYLRILNLLKESTDIIKNFEEADIVPNDKLSQNKIQQYKIQLSNCRKQLIDEQLQSIDDKQTTIKVQKQFQKVLSDFNSAIYELEILKDENIKLTTMQSKFAEETIQKMEESEKRLNEEKRVLENEKTTLLEERISLQLKKKSFIEDKEKIESEWNSLALEKERLNIDRANLLEEKTSLDQQSKLYEAEEGALQKEKRDKKIIVKAFEDLFEDFKKLKAESAKELDEAKEKIKECEETILAYKIQTSMHQNEFEEMRTTQKNLQDQLQQLSMVNLHLRNENSRLGGNESGQNPPDSSRYCGLCAKYVVPGERHGPGTCAPDFD